LLITPHSSSSKQDPEGGRFCHRPLLGPFNTKGGGAGTPFLSNPTGHLNFFSDSSGKWRPPRAKGAGPNKRPGGNPAREFGLPPSPQTGKEFGEFEFAKNLARGCGYFLPFKSARAIPSLSKRGRGAKNGGPSGLTIFNPFRHLWFFRFPFVPTSCGERRLDWAKKN